MPFMLVSLEVGFALYSTGVPDGRARSRVFLAKKESRPIARGIAQTCGPGTCPAFASPRPQRCLPPYMPQMPLMQKGFSCADPDLCLMRGPCGETAGKREAMSECLLVPKPFLRSLTQIMKVLQRFTSFGGSFEGIPWNTILLRYWTWMLLPPQPCYLQSCPESCFKKLPVTGGPGWRRGGLQIPYGC